MGKSEFRADMLWGIAGVGPTMTDGNALFTAGHGNLGTPSTAPAEAPLSQARKSMRLQTGPQGKLISVEPRFILTCATIETATEKVLSAVQAAATSNVNPFAGKLTLVIEPRLDAYSATGWYVFADPSAAARA